MRKIILIALLFISVLVNATEYYVSPSGSNGANGLTTGTAWQTIAYAAAHVSSGDRINLMSGTHAVTGIIDVPVGVNINGLDTSLHTVTGTVTTFEEGIFRLQSTEGTSGGQSITNVNFYGGDLAATSSAIVVYGRSNDSIKYCRFTNFKYSAVLFAGQASFYPNAVPPTTYSTGNYFGYNYVWNCGGFFGFGYAALWAHGTEGLVLEYNYMNQTSRADGDNGWLIKLLDYHKGTKIRYNTLVKKPFPYDEDGVNNYFGFAIESADQQGCEVNNNTIQGSIDFNRQSKGSYAYSVYIHDNIIQQPSTPAHKEYGIILEYNTHDAVISNNQLINVSAPIFFSFHDTTTVGVYTPDTVTNTVIAENELRNIGTSQFGGGIGELIQFHVNDPDTWIGNNIDIWNNTATCNPTYPTAWGFSFSGNGGVTDLNVQNNIVTGVVNNWIVSGTSNLMSIVTVTNNCPYNNGSSNAAGWFAGNPSSYTYTNPLAGSNPLFVSSTDLHLQSGSPCIGAGTDVGYGTDVGAYQYGDSPPSVTSTTPTSSATGVSISVHPTGTFSEALNAATVTTTNVTMTQGVTPVTISVSYLSNVITVTPSSPLSYSTNYTVNFGTGITDVGGLPLATTYSWSFTTAAAPSTGGGFTIKGLTGRIGF